MGQDGTGIALARIERALARIEAASSRPSAPVPASDDGAAEELRRAHQALRARVEGAIADLDDLIASGGQG